MLKELYFKKQVNYFCWQIIKTALLYVWTVFEWSDFLEKLENQRELIFKAAKEILNTEDISKFSIRMISNKCNIGIGTIYKYYGNKTDILLDVTKNLWMSYLKYIKTNVDSNYDFVQRISFYHTSLVTYSREFNYDILSKELSYSFHDKGKVKHDEAQNFFIEVVKQDAITYLNMDVSDAYTLANFICNNLVALIKMKNYEYSTFQIILEKLLKTT